MKVEHIQLEYGRKDYLFISKEMTIFEVNELFTQSKRNGEKLSALFITETGNSNEEIQGMISSGDANLIDEYYVNQKNKGTAKSIHVFLIKICISSLNRLYLV